MLQRSRTWTAGIALFAGVSIFFGSLRTTADGMLTVRFFDVGQGDAIFIETPHGNHVLIDTGDTDAVLRELARVMGHKRFLDVVMMTHPDSDHTGSASDVLTKYDVGMALVPGVASDAPAYEAFERMLLQKGIRKILARRGMRIELDEDVYLLFLFPDRDVVGLAPNDASLVVKLVYGNTSFLFTGDSSQKIEEYLVALDEKLLDVDVLKVGHHGSKTASSPLFVGATSPHYAIISSGADNRYGHPHEEVLEVFESMDVSILRTDTDGTIVIKSDGENIFVFPSLRAERSNPESSPR